MNVKWADVKNDYARKDAEIEALKDALSSIIQSAHDNTGHEPSLSVFQRDITMALLKAGLRRLKHLVIR